MIMLFLLSLFIVFYTYLGYAVVIYLYAKCKPREVNKGENVPAISIVLIVRNEEKYIESRIENLLSLDYPEGLVDIVIVSDGSTDQTADLVKARLSESIKFIEIKRGRGKPACLNEVIKSCKGDIVVFADARQKFDANVLRELAANFNDEDVGVVSGELMFEDSEKTTVGEGIDFYWKYEKFLRRCESRVDSTTGATGAVYSIRRELIMPIPEDTLLDDVLIPMYAVFSGYRCVFESEAKAYDLVAETEEQEERRKIRTIAGNVQLFWRHKSWLCPCKNRIWLQTFSHKFLRLIAPFFLLLMLVSNVFILNIFFFKIVFILQGLFYLCGFTGFLLRGRKKVNKVFYAPYVFIIMNLFTLKALGKSVFADAMDLWEK